MSKFYDLSAKLMNGKEVSMEEYKGRVVLVVNTASKCGLTPQFEGLQALYNKYSDKGLVILGFPCGQFLNQELESGEKIVEFCSLNYGVSFPMFAKIDVNGENEHEIFKFLKTSGETKTASMIKWNFTKFLIDHEGNFISRYAPITKPDRIEKDIIRQIKMLN